MISCITWGHAYMQRATARDDKNAAPLWSLVLLCFVGMGLCVHANICVQMDGPCAMFCCFIRADQFFFHLFMFWLFYSFIASKLFFITFSLGFTLIFTWCFFHECFSCSVTGRATNSHVADNYFYPWLDDCYTHYVYYLNII